MHISVTLVLFSVALVQYGNAASASVESFESANSSANNDVCFCTYDYRPVCGSDGHTYSNECVLKCAQKTRPNVHAICEKECPCTEIEKKFNTSPLPEASEHEQRVCACPKIWAPVCGSDGKTYGNGCMVRCAQEDNPNLTQVREGEC